MLVAQGLEDLIKETNKKFKSNIVNHGVVYGKVQKVPFSSPRLNYMLYGGLPVKRITEFSGGEGSGKTTTALDAVGNFQRAYPDRKVLYIDCENTLDIQWAQLLGVNLEDLILLQPETETAEQIFEIALNFIATGEISLTVIDSLGVMVSAQAYDKDMEGKTYGGISQSLTLFSRKVIPLLAKYDSTLIGINQMRDDMNSNYGGVITTGGRAWRHNCSVRLMFQQSDFVDEKGVSVSRGHENPSGNLIKCTIVKTKVCRPDRKIGFYTLKYLEGIDYISDTIDVAEKEGLIERAGAWYTVLDFDTREPAIGEDGKPVKFQGKAKLTEFFVHNPEWFDELFEQINIIVS